MHIRTVCEMKVNYGFGTEALKVQVLCLWVRGRGAAEFRAQ